jgi:hypothetical protein
MRSRIVETLVASVYDGSKIFENPNLFKNQENNKIKEYVCKDEGTTGNPQRNYGLSKITNSNTSLYFLDDDNTVHPNLYRLLNIIDNKIYTFNQHNRLKGDNIEVFKIDTAMYIIPYNLYKDVKVFLSIFILDEGTVS